MTRQFFIERALRQIYNGYVSDDSEITINLVNGWLNDAIAAAAKANYTDNIKIDGIGYVNNSFYTTYKNIPVTLESRGVWKAQLPHIPFGIGRNEGISILQFKDGDNNVSLPCIPISENQRTYFQSMRPLSSKVIFYYEGDYVYAVSTILLSQYTANVTMVSGGDGNDLTSTLNVPSDYHPVMVEYIKQQLLVTKQLPKDLNNDGRDLAG